MRNDLESLRETERATTIKISTNEDVICNLQTEHTALSEEVNSQADRLKILAGQVDGLKVWSLV